MKRLCYFLLLFLVSIAIFANNEEDYGYLVDKLPKLHTDFYNGVDEVVFKAFTNSKTNLDNLSDMEFYYLLMETTAFAKDSHTSVGLKQIPNNLRLLPLRFIVFADGIFIYATGEENLDLLGTKLKSINGKSIEDIIQLATAVIPHDNDVFLEKQVVGSLIYVDFLKYIGIIDDIYSPILITACKEDIDFTKELVGVPITEENGSSYTLVFKDFPKTFSYGSYFNAFPINTDLFYIQYNVCQNAIDMSVEEFSNKIKSMLKAGSYKKVIVDFRYNSGGNSSLFEPFLEWLSEQNYKLYGLIGKDTFSSAVMNSLYFKTLGAELVGTPTGGSINGYGEVKSFSLPSGRYIVYYSTKYFRLDNSYESSLNPDVYISTTFEDFLSLCDREVEYCIRN